MKTVLHIPFYRDKNPVRQGEIMYCLHKNLQAGFDIVQLYVDGKDDAVFISKYLNIIEKEAGLLPDFTGKTTINLILFDTRPTFNHFLKECSNTANYLNVISNTDIFFTPETIAKIIERMNVKPDDALCLSRWDVQANGIATHFNRWDSQDVWVINGAAKGKTTIDFTMGIAGCDNRFAWELKNMGYNISNPSKTIQVFHKHESAVRNYLNDQGAPVTTVPAPYEMVTPE